MRVWIRRAALALGLCVVTGLQAKGQATYQFKPTGTGSTWLNAANWVGDTPLTVPGLDLNPLSLGDGSSTDVAIIDAYAFTGNTLGIDMGNGAGGVSTDAGAGGQLSLGAISYTGSTKPLIIGDNSSTSGVLLLNGAYAANSAGLASNVILSNTSGQTLTLQDNGGGAWASSTTLTLKLGQASNVINAGAGSTIIISSTIGQASPGASIVFNGGFGSGSTSGGLLNLTGANTFSGPVIINSGRLTSATATALGTGTVTETINSGGTLYASAASAFTIGSNISYQVSGLGFYESTTPNYLGAIRLNNATLAGNVTLAGNTRIGTFGSESGTISGGISGAFQLEKFGTGTLTLSGNNSGLTGGILVNGGRLAFAGSSAVPTSGKIIIGVGSIVSDATGYTLDQSLLNRIDGSSSGLVALNVATNSNNLDFSAPGLTNVSLGASAAVTYSGTITPANNTYRLGGGSGTLTVSSVLADGGGSRSLIVGSAGSAANTTILTGANSYTGTTTINAGTLTVQGTGKTGSGAIIVNGNSTFSIDNSTSATVVPRLSASQSLSVNGGFLSLKGNNAAATAETAGTYNFQGFSSFNFTAGTGATNVITASGLNQVHNGVLLIQGTTLGGPIGLAGSTNLQFTAAPPTILQAGVNAMPYAIMGGSGDPRFVQYDPIDGVKSIDAPYTSMNGGFANASAGSYAQLTGNSGVPASTAGSPIAVAGLRVDIEDIAGDANGSVLQMTSGSLMYYTTTGSRSFVTGGGTGDFSNPSGNGALTLDMNGNTAYISLLSSTNFYTNGAGGRELILNAPITNTGGNGLVLSGQMGNIFRLNATTSTFNGLTINGINQGPGVNNTAQPFAVNFNSDANLGAAGGTITANNGFLVYRNHRQDIADTAISTTITRGLVLDGVGSARQGLGVTAAGSVLTWNGTVSGPGTLTKIGAGTLVLGGANTYGGGTSIEAGTLAISTDGNLGAAGTPLLLNGGSLQANSALTINRPVLIAAGGGNLNTNGNAVTLSGALSTPSGSYGAFTKSGAGTLTLSAASTVASPFTVSGGTLSLAGNGSLLQAGAFNISGGSTFTLDNSAANLADRIATQVALSGGNFVFTGNGSAASSESIGELVIGLGSNNFTITPGAGQSASVTAAGFRNNGGTITFNAANLGQAGSAAHFFIAGQGQGFIPGVSVADGQPAAGLGFYDTTPGVGLRRGTAADFTAVGTGQLFVALQNSAPVNLPKTSYPRVITTASTGAAGENNTVAALALADGASVTILSSTTLTLTSGLLISEAGSAGQSISGGTLSSGGAALSVTDDNSGTLSISSAIAGSGGILKTGAGTLSLSGANTFTGGINVNGGVVTLASGGSLAANSLGLGAGSTFNVNAPATFTSVTGTGALNVGANTSVTTLNAAGSINLGNGSILTVTGGSQTIPAMISGGGAMTYSSTGTVTIGGNSAYGGGTTLTSGNLAITDANALGTGALKITSTAASTLDTTGLPVGAQTLANDLVLPNDATGTNRTILIRSGAGNVLQLAGNISGGGPGTVLFLNTSTAGDSAGIYRLSGNNTFTGRVNINRGSVQIDSDAALGASSNVLSVDSNPGVRVIFTNPMTFTHPMTLTSADVGFDVGANDVLATGAYSGTVGMNKLGTGTLTFTSSHSFSGATTISGGTLSVATLDNGGAPSGIGSSSSASGSLVFNGNGATLKYTGGGATTDRLFTLAANGAVIDASGTGPLVFNNSGPIGFAGAGPRSLTLTGTNTALNTLSQTIADNGAEITSITKSGSGTWVMNGNYGYSGPTNITGGKLIFDGTYASNGNFTVAGGGTLGGNGTISSVTLSSGAAVSPGDNVGQLLTTGLSTTGGASMNFDLSINPGGTNDKLSILGDFAIGHANGKTAININPVDGALGVGDYDLISFSGAYTGDANVNNEFTLNGVGSGGQTRQTFSLVKTADTSGVIQLHVSGATAALIWKGQAGNGDWDVATTSNWLNNGNSDKFFNGDTVAFDNSATNFNVNLKATVKPAVNVAFNNDSAHNYTLSGAGKISGAVGLTKDGNGTLNISNTGINDYTGTTMLNDGRIVQGVANALPTGTALTVGSSATFDLGGFAAQVGGLIGNGTVTNTGPAAKLTVSNALPATFDGIIQNGSGVTSLEKAGAGTLTLTANQTFTGATTISAGTLELGSGGGTGSLAGPVVDNANLQLNRSDDLDYSSIVISGTGSLTKLGGGTLIPSSNNSYTGATLINGGTIQVAAMPAGGVASPLGASTGAAANLVLNGGALRYTGGTASTDRGFTMGTLGGTIEVVNAGATLTTSGVSAGNATIFNKNGPGTLELTSANALNGIGGGFANVNEGVLRIASQRLGGSGDDSTQRHINIASNAALETTGTLFLDPSFNTGPYTTLVSGDGTLRLKMTASTAATPDIFYDSTGGDGSGWGVAITTPVDMGSTHRYVAGLINRNDFEDYQGDLRFDGVISGTGGVTFVGGPNNSGHRLSLVISQPNTFTGGVTLSDNVFAILVDPNAFNGDNNAVDISPSAGQTAGIYLYGHDATIGTLTGNADAVIRNGSGSNDGTQGANPQRITGPSTLTIVQKVNGEFGGIISDGPSDDFNNPPDPNGDQPLNIIKAGPGTLTLSRVNGYTGTTTINAGTLTVSGSIATSTGVTVNDGGTYEAAGTQSIQSLALSSGGKAKISGSGGVKVLTVGTGTSATPLVLAGTAKIDISTHAMVVDTDPGSQTAMLTSVRKSIISAYNASSPGAGDGNWGGSGITSTAAAAKPGQFGVGYALASEVAPGGTFLGSPADASSVVTRYTLLGDADLSGGVGFPDLVAVAQNYGANFTNPADPHFTESWWAHGDFNYDGLVNFSDLVKVAQGYGTSLPASAIPGASADFEADLARAFSSVPEPSSFAVVGLGAMLMGLSRRHRRNG